MSLLVLAICSCAALVGGNVIANSAQQSGGSSVAGSSTESSPATKLGAGHTILLDAWYNSQKRADAKGNQVYFHYKWNDETDSGYSVLGEIFRNYGGETKMLFVAPTVDNLRDGEGVYHRLPLTFQGEESDATLLELKTPSRLRNG